MSKNIKHEKNHKNNILRIYNKNSALIINEFACYIILKVVFIDFDKIIKDDIGNYSKS